MTEIRMGKIFFVDETGDHRIPEDGNVFECDFCLKAYFVSHSETRAVFGPGGTGGFCSETCRDWYKGIRNGSIDPLAGPSPAPEASNEHV